MEDYTLTQNNIKDFWDKLQDELSKNQSLVVTVSPTGKPKWGMARLWRWWMGDIAKYMNTQGITVKLAGKKGEFYEREAVQEDAHIYFTTAWLGTDERGTRLSWAKKDHDGMRAATKGERWSALRKCDIYCLERHIQIFRPRGSEYEQLREQQEREG